MHPMSLANPIASGLTQEQVALIKRQIAPKATNDELALFVAVCNRTQLDPFSRQVHCVHRWSGRDKREVMSIQVSIDGFRLIAQRSGEYAGQAGPEWCGEDGVWRDVWLSKEPPRAARVGVMRTQFKQPLYRTAHWDEYRPLDKEGRLMGMWGKMPALMLGKVAEALALRSAFPAETSGLYTEDEMAQAMHSDSEASRPPRTAQEQPALPTPVSMPEMPPSDSGASNAVTEDKPARRRVVKPSPEVVDVQATPISESVEAVSPAATADSNGQVSEPPISYTVDRPPRDSKWGKQMWRIVKIGNGREGSNGSMRWPILFRNGDKEEWASCFSDTLVNELSRASSKDIDLQLFAVSKPPYGMTVYGVREHDGIPF